MHPELVRTFRSRERHYPSNIASLPTAAAPLLFVLCGHLYRLCWKDLVTLLMNLSYGSKLKQELYQRSLTYIQQICLNQNGYSGLGSDLCGTAKHSQPFVAGNPVSPFERAPECLAILTTA